MATHLLRDDELDAKINTHIEEYKLEVVEVAREFMKKGDLCLTEAENIWEKLRLPGRPEQRFDASFTVRIDLRGIEIDPSSSGSEDDIEGILVDALNELELSEGFEPTITLVDTIDVTVTNAVVQPVS